MKRGETPRDDGWGAWGRTGPDDGHKHRRPREERQWFARLARWRRHLTDKAPQETVDSYNEFYGLLENPNLTYAAEETV